MCLFGSLRRCCARKKWVWGCSILALAFIVSIFVFRPQLREPRIVTITAYAFVCSVGMSCCLLWCNNPRSAGSISSPPTNEDAMAQNLTEVTVPPKTGGLPPKIDYKDKLPKKSAPVDLQKGSLDQYLPSYHEAVAPSRISNDTVVELEN